MKANRFLSPYVRSADVKAAVLLTVASVEAEELGLEDQKEEKLVAYFAELDQGAVLGSKAVLNFFVDEFGEDTNGWVGKKVIMYKDPTIEYMGKRVGGIRFRLPDEENPLR
jgi:hypothetical protein